MTSNVLSTGDIAQIVASAAAVVQYATLGAALYSSDVQESQPYHTSALSGYAWVQELIHGNPRRIYTELGVRLHVFLSLLITLRTMGYGDSRNN
jgi:hypothetical protein